MSTFIHNTPNWDELKQGVYNEDGSLRDIYILDTNKEDWIKWIDFVNNTCNLIWTAEECSEEESTRFINREFIAERWSRDALSTCASIFLGSIQVNCFFFTEDEIENDIDPREIKSIADHQAVITYMKAISKLLCKEVLLTEENYRILEGALIRVNGDNIFFT